MRLILLITILAICFCQLSFIGKCGMAPKYRPLDCYKNSVLPEDMNELSEILKKFKKGGDDKEFANIIGDLFDKKKFREKKTSHIDERRIGSCGMHPKYLPVECYEQNVLRRDKNKIRAAYEKYHGNNLKKFNEEYLQLIKEKLNYYNSKK